VLPRQGRQPAPVLGSEELDLLGFGRGRLWSMRVFTYTKGGLQNRDPIGAGDRTVAYTP